MAGAADHIAQAIDVHPDGTVQMPGSVFTALLELAAERGAERAYERADPSRMLGAVLPVWSKDPKKPTICTYFKVGRDTAYKNIDDWGLPKRSFGDPRKVVGKRSSGGYAVEEYRRERRLHGNSAALRPKDPMLKRNA